MLATHLIRWPTLITLTVLGFLSLGLGSVGSSIGSLPKFIEQNRGQFPPQYDFGFRGENHLLLFNSQGISFYTVHSRNQTTKVTFTGCRRNGRRAYIEKLPGESNYLLGELSEWITNVSHIRSVLYKDVYPGIDLRFRTANGLLEYDLLVSPEGEIGDFEFRIHGADSYYLNREGDLVIRVGEDRFVQHRPTVFQKIELGSNPIPCTYSIRQDSVFIELESYDPSEPLVVDPVLSYMAIVPGSGSESEPRIAIGPNGRMYIAGTTKSSDLPTKGGFQSNYQGGVFGDGFVLCLSPDGSDVVFMTYVGGAEADAIRAISVDASGIYVAGTTSSTNFPTQNGYQGDQGTQDAFLAKLTLAGNALHFSTYIGGKSSEYAWDLDLGSDGVFVVGGTSSTDFPVKNAIQSQLKSTGSSGQDYFLTKFNRTGALQFSTYLGGSEYELGFPFVDAFGDRVYFASVSRSTDFPTKDSLRASPQIQDVVLMALDSITGQLQFSTFWGGNGMDELGDLTVDDQGNIYLLGNTPSGDFPVVNPLPAQREAPPGAFITKFNSDFNVMYSHLFQRIGFQEGRAIAVSDSRLLLGYAASLHSIETVDPLPGNYTYGPYVALLAPDGVPIFSSIVAEDGTVRGVEMDQNGSIVFVGVSSRSEDIAQVNSPFSRLAGEGFDVFLGKISLDKVRISAQGTQSGPGETVRVPIQIDKGDAASAFRFQILFDQTQVSFLNRVESGELLTDHTIGFSVDANRISVIAFSSSGSMLSAPQGTLAHIPFRVAEDAAVGTSTGIQLISPEVSDGSGQSLSVDSENGQLLIAPAGTWSEEYTSEIVFPQVANGQFQGGNFVTTLIFVNRAAEKPRARIEFVRSDGFGFDISLTDGRFGSTFGLDIPASGSLFLQTDGLGPLAAGYARVRSTTPLGGTLIFSAVNSTGVALSEAAVAVSPISTRALLPILIGAGADTGIAVANVSLEPATISMQLVDSVGNIRGLASRDLPAGEHFALFASEIFTALEGRPDFEGTVEITSNHPISVVALKQEGILLTTFPVLEPLPVEANSP